eukprot:5582130-Pyramimonas_sp.AAC.1
MFATRAKGCEPSQHQRWSAERVFSQLSAGDVVPMERSYLLALRAVVMPDDGPIVAVPPPPPPPATATDID